MVTHRHVERVKQVEKVVGDAVSPISGHIDASDPVGDVQPVEGRLVAARSAFGGRFWCRGGVQGLASVAEMQVGGGSKLKSGEREGRLASEQAMFGRGMFHDVG